MAGHSRTDQLSTRRTARPVVAAAALILLPILIVAGLLILLMAVRNRAESTVADLAALIPLGWAFAAGMVASVNPCGFFMLPAYVSYQLGARSAIEGSSRFSRGARAVGLGVVATSGFLLVLAAVGGVTAVGGQWLIRTFPYVGVAIGAALTALGAWMLRSGRTIGLLAASRVHVTPQRSTRNVFLFGLAYAAGSLSCTLPVFLLVVGTSLASQGLLASFGQFISFGLGMGTILMAVTIGTALFQDAATRLLRAIVPYVQRVSALFLIGAGLYLVYYWIWFSGSIL